MERMLTVKDLAEYFSVSEDRIYQLTREGILPHFRLGRTIRYSSAALEKFVAEGGKARSDRSSTLKAG